MSIDYLDLDDLLAVIERVVGPEASVRDYGLLESALARPQATVFGEDAYPGLLPKAAALTESLVRNHALVDGNKRLGYAAGRLFLLLNGHDYAATEDERYDFILGIAGGSLSGVEAISKALATLTTPLA